MSEEYKLPKEQRAKDEAEISKISWSKGPYSFLLQRTQKKYHLKANQKRRLLLEQQLNVTLPMITDEMLLALYKYSCEKYLKDCHKKYNFSSGFGSTPSERKFAAILQAITAANPILKHLEIYPSLGHSSDLPSNFKMVVGNYVPDFLIFGLKIKGASAVAVEIDGDFHVEKWSKDELRNTHLKELKIFVWEVQNNQATDLAYLTKAILNMYRLRNGSLNGQIQRAKRKIWVKTISCQLSLSEIELFALSNFSIDLNLTKEAVSIENLQNCPRVIKREMALLF